MNEQTETPALAVLPDPPSPAVASNTPPTPAAAPEPAPLEAGCAAATGEPERVGWRLGPWAPNYQAPAAAPEPALTPAPAPEPAQPAKREALADDPPAMAELEMLVESLPREKLHAWYKFAADLRYHVECRINRAE